MGGKKGFSCIHKYLLPFLILIILAVPLRSYVPCFRSVFVPAVSVQSKWRTSRLPRSASWIGSFVQALGFNTILEEEGRKVAVGIWWNYILSIILGALRGF